MEYETKKFELQRARTTQKLVLQFPIYEDQEDMEILLKLLREFNRAVDRYQVWTDFEMQECTICSRTALGATP